MLQTVCSRSTFAAFATNVLSGSDSRAERCQDEITESIDRGLDRDLAQILKSHYLVRLHVAKY